MQTIVLEHPRITSKERFNDIANTPLWSCLMGGYAAAALERKGFDTIFLNEAVEASSFDNTKEKILTFNPDILFINAVYFWEHTYVLFDFIAELRSLGFSGHINLFGFFPSLIYRKILKKYKQVDSIAVGEFEHTITELAEAIKNNKSLESIEGLALKSCLNDNASRIRTPVKNPDEFAFPKRSTLEGVVTILASRGCYNHCSFCPIPSFYNRGPLWRGRSPENVADEIGDLVSKGVKDFYFCDPNFIGPGTTGKKRIIHMMDLIKPMNIKFGMETRPQDLDDDILAKLVDAGFETLLMGVESGSSDILDRIGKSSLPNHSSKAIKLCRKHGIEPEIGFLMFVPDSSLKDLKKNMSFLMENKLLDNLERTANLLSHSQIILAGTSGYRHFEKIKRLKKKGILGFEGEVRFVNPDVDRIADLMTFACRIVLKSMGDEKSLIFWEKGNTDISQRVNDYLVELIYELIDEAEKNTDKLYIKDVKIKKKEILEEINSIIRK